MSKAEKNTEMAQKQNITVFDTHHSIMKNF